MAQHASSFTIHAYIVKCFHKIAYCKLAFQYKSDTQRVLHNNNNDNNKNVFPALLILDLHLQFNLNLSGFIMYNNNRL